LKSGPLTSTHSAIALDARLNLDIFFCFYGLYYIEEKETRGFFLFTLVMCHHCAKTSYFLAIQREALVGSLYLMDGSKNREQYQIN
jgi:hypothetical protein